MEANIHSLAKQTEEVDAEISGANNVKGVLLADSRGFCITAQGECRKELAGPASNLAALAGQIEPEEENPVILIESGVRKYLVKKEENHTIVVAKPL